jgi:hypothetical protein
MTMHVFINEREVGAVDAVGATVGEMIDALSVHVDPDEIVTTVEIDGVSFSAGEEERYARRAAASVRRLVLGTATPAAFARGMRAELAAAVEVVAAKVELVVARFGSGDDRDANALLAALLEELRLALVLEQQVTTLDGALVREAIAPVENIAPALLSAQERRAWGELATLLAERLAPALRAWSRAESAVATAETDAAPSSTF